jgi:translocation and assembly module TamB
VFVADLASLLAVEGSVAAPERRPPYFSVKERPYGDWTLDVAVRGEDCLRIENPFFKGTISADFKITGTLEEPRAIGRIWSDRGTVIFPFGSMRLEEFEAALTSQNPFEPVISATASTRLYGYDMRMEVSGSASDPRLLFSSDPPLTSQELFLLLSTGAMPDSENSFTTGERAQRLAVFIGQNLASSLGLVGGSGDSERLVVRSGEDISREGGETVHVEFSLDGRWSLVGEKDRFDAYNGGVKFRLIER